MRTWKDIESIHIGDVEAPNPEVWELDIIYKDQKWAELILDKGIKNEDMLAVAFETIKSQLESEQ